jgi:hypothetical protein
MPCRGHALNDLGRVLPGQPGQEALDQVLSGWDRSSSDVEALVCSVRIAAVRSAADSGYRVHGPIEA